MNLSNAENAHDKIVEQFTAAMRERGIDVDEPIIADGKLHRYRVKGDRSRNRNAWGVLYIDECPAGEFGCNKRYPGEKFSWQMKQARGLTPAERAAMKEKASLRAVQREAEEAQRHQEAAARALAIYESASPVPKSGHPYLTHKSVPSSPKLRVGKWYRTDEDTGEEILVCENALIVPMMVSTTRILSLQAILPDESGFRKQFMKGGQTAGTFVCIGTPRDDTILICEGLATGLSLWQCTEHGVLVAFTAGNLDQVVRQVRLHRPETRILICADNDAWTLRPIQNPGIHYAREAATRSGALMVFPEFINNDTKPTDFNDLHTLEGEDIVRSLIARALDPTPAETGQVLAVDEQVPPPPDGTEEDQGGFEGPATNPYFAILGYDHGIYYFFQHEQRQIIEYTKGDLNDGGFIELADTNWWEENFAGAKGGIDKRGAMNFIIRTANKRGIFTPDKIRGRGAWVDQGRAVFHHGQDLTVDGEKVEVTGIQSKFVYELAAAHCQPAERSMTDAEGFALLELAGKFRWTMPGSAALLMGWIALAPLCGALKWRPHIWITGNAGSGKSTVVESIVNRLLAGMCLFGLGGSTEAGIRQKLRSDALPVLIDESEQNEEKDITRIQAMLGLMRQASTESEARTFKGTPGGTAMVWYIRSMFCLSSIQVGVKHQADTERISILALQPKLTDGHAAEQWETLREQIHTRIVQEPEISGRLFRRTLGMLSTILANVEVFKSAAARVFKSQRVGDQYGTLLAGCFALFTTRLATPADAEWVINNYAWTEHVESDRHDESAGAFECLIAQPIKCGVHDLTLIEVINVARGRLPHPAGVDISADEANQHLGRHGMKIDDEQDLLIANNNSRFRDLMKGTDYSADPRGLLLRSPHITKNDNKTERINSVPTKCLRCNLRALLAESITASVVEPPTPF